MLASDLINMKERRQEGERRREKKKRREGEEEVGEAEGRVRLVRYHPKL